MNKDGRQRLLSLDVYRGMTIAGMILVTDPGDYTARYRPLQHVDWEGGTLTDMIFPSFLFVTGASLVLSTGRRLSRGETRGSVLLQAAKRCVLLVLIGLFLNGFPDFALGHLRLPGILQRIGICWLLVCAAYVWMPAGKENRMRRIVLLGSGAAALLAVYWALLRWVPVPGFGAGRVDTLGSLPAWLDRSLMGANHLWAFGLTPGMGVTFDPEGVLSTLGALATVLTGAMAAEWIARGKGVLLGLAAGGAGLMALGFALQPAMPMIKKIWTPTFGLASSGFCLLVFALLYWLIDTRGWRWWTAPAEAFGTNSILAFTLSSVITVMLDRWRVDGVTLHALGNRMALRTGLSPINASLLYAVSIVLVNLLLVWPLYRRRIFLRL